MYSSSTVNNKTEKMTKIVTMRSMHAPLKGRTQFHDASVQCYRRFLWSARKHGYMSMLGTNYIWTATYVQDTFQLYSILSIINHPYIYKNHWSIIRPYATQHYKQMLKPIHCELHISANLDYPFLKDKTKWKFTEIHLVIIINGLLHQ